MLYILMCFVVQAGSLQPMKGPKNDGWFEKEKPRSVVYAGQGGSIEAAKGLLSELEQQLPSLVTNSPGWGRLDTLSTADTIIQYNQLLSNSWAVRVSHYNGPSYMILLKGLQSHTDIKQDILSAYIDRLNQPFDVPFQPRLTPPSAVNQALEAQKQAALNIVTEERADRTAIKGEAEGLWSDLTKVQTQAAQAAQRAEADRKARELEEQQRQAALLEQQTREEAARLAQEQADRDAAALLAQQAVQIVLPPVTEDPVVPTTPASSSAGGGIGPDAPPADSTETAVTVVVSTDVPAVDPNVVGGTGAEEADDVGIEQEWSEYMIKILHVLMKINDVDYKRTLAQTMLIRARQAKGDLNLPVNFDGLMQKMIRQIGASSGQSKDEVMADFEYLRKDLQDSDVDLNTYLARKRRG